MNDLEHDLRELFEQRASGVDVPGLAPADVVRRGRRRQVGTVVTGVLACLVAAGIAAAAIGQTRHPAVIPVGNGLPERTTSIGGVPVTAPAGWTLVDDWPLAALLSANSQECSFTASGTAIDQNGSPVEASPVSDGAEQPSCTSTPVGYPAGLPLLQLANFEIPLMRTVCGLGDQEGPASVPDDGVAVYVGVFPANAKPFADPGACSSSVDPPIAVAQTRGLSDSILAAAVVAGPSATQADLATATGYVRSLDGIMVDETPPAAEGPGYVMATGQGGGISWRLEAAITSFDHQDGAPTVGAVMATTTSVDTGSRTVDLSTSQRVNDDYIDLGPAGIVQFGTATSEVSGIDIVDPSGGIQSAHRFSWPAALGSLPGVLAAPTGWLWYASAAERGTVRPLMASAPTAAPTGDPGASLEPGELPMKETSNGFVIYGNDLGHDWQLAHENGRMELFLDGSTESAGSFTFVIGSETQIDVPGGAFLISLRDKTVTDFAASIDATDQQPSTTIDGGWQRIQDVNGDDGRVWIVPLPGWGTGTEQANDDLPNFVSWPSSPLRDGTLLSGGSDGVVSWGLSWRNDHCVVLETIGADPGNSGSSECLPPWTDLKNNPLIGGVYGSTRATVAMVLTHRPPTTTTSPDLNDGALQCDNIDMESNFAGTTICVFPVDVGHPVEIHVSQEAGPLSEVVALEAEPGRLNQIQPGTTDATSSPSTVP